MTMPSLPARGDKDWRDNWAQAVHNAAAEVVSGRLTEAALREAFVRRQVDGVRAPRIDKVVTNFQAGHGFTVLGGAANAASFADDTTTVAVGSQSIAVGLKSDGVPTNVQNTALPAFDATGKALTVTLRVDDTTNLTQLLVYATSDPTFASYYSWTVQDNALEAQRWWKSGEWQTLTLSFADAAVIGTPNRAALNTLRLRAGAASGASTTVRYNRVALVPAPVSEAVVSICIDDLYASTWAVMRPILDKYGFAATAYAIPERATDAYVSLSRLHRLEDVSGWEVAGHGLTDLTTMSLADAEADLIRSRTWLQDNGFRGVDHYAYPGGGYNPAIEAIMRRLYRSGRTINSRTRGETTPPANAYRLRSLSVSNTTPVSTVTAAITAAKAQGSWFILTLHDIVTANATLGTQYLAADLDAICAHIAAQGVQVKTVGDVLAGVSETAGSSELGFAPVSTPIHVGDANGMFGTGGLSDGVVTDGNLEARHNLAADVGEFQLVYVNNNTTADGPNDITVRAGVLVNAVYLPVFFGGKRDVVIGPGGRITSDPVTITTAGVAYIESRTRVSVAAGEKWPITYQCVTARSEWAVTGTAGDDYTTSGSIASNSVAGYGPVALLAKTAVGDRDVVALVGDSITAGTGATAPTQQNSFSRLAATAKGKTSILLGNPGSASTTGYGFGFRFRAAALAGATHSIEMYGTNDIGTMTLATLQTRLIGCWRDRQTRGIRAYACTLPPRTDSGGNLTTRVQINDWLRAGAPITTAYVATTAGAPGSIVAGQPGHPLVGWFDTADAVETARNSGEWKASHNADASHPNATGHQAMADAIVAQWPTSF